MASATTAMFMAILRITSRLSIRVILTVIAALTVVEGRLTNLRDCCVGSGRAVPTPHRFNGG
jgi:hypothetical protein